MRWKTTDEKPPEVVILGEPQGFSKNVNVVLDFPHRVRRVHIGFFDFCAGVWRCPQGTVDESPQIHVSLWQPLPALPPLRSKTTATEQITAPDRH